MTKRLYRSRSNRVIAGVAAGIADYFGVDPIIVRLLFIILAFGQGSGLLAYIIGWIIIPEEPQTEESKKDQPSPEPKEKANTEQSHIYNASTPEEERPRYFLGLVFIFIGAILIIQNLFGYHFWRLIVPVILVGIGLAIIARNMGPNKS
jgi:phage shock protein C